MVKLKLIDISVILLIISALDLLLFGLLYVMIGFCPFQFEYLGMTWTEIVALDADLALMISVTYRLAGFGWISIVLGIFLVLFKGYRNGEKWAWWFMLFALGPVLLSASILIPLDFGIALYIIWMSTALWILALLIGAKEILMAE